MSQVERGDHLAEAKRLLGNAEKAGEQTFVLVGHDRTAAATVAFWIYLNIETAPDDKLRDALEHALDMRKTPNRKAAD
jgi:hypothetical protein